MSEALQLASVPVLIPLHAQFQGPDPVTDQAFPALHKFIFGVLKKDNP